MIRPSAKLEPCWHCGAPTTFRCASCLKPVCVTVGFTATPSVSCSVLRKKRNEIGVYRLVCWPKCIKRRHPNTIALIAKRTTPTETENPPDPDLEPIWQCGDPWPWEAAP